MAANGTGSCLSGSHFSTTRLDLSTRLSLMATILFAIHSPDINEREALETAIKINDLTDQYVKGTKPAQDRARALGAGAR